MSDRPEITAKAEGARIRVDKSYDGIGATTFWLTPQECFALQCELSAAYQAAIDNRIQEIGVIVPESDMREAKINFREWM